MDVGDIVMWIEPNCKWYPNMTVGTVAIVMHLDRLDHYTEKWENNILGRRRHAAYVPMAQRWEPIHDQIGMRMGVVSVATDLEEDTDETVDPIFFDTPTCYWLNLSAIGPKMTQEVRKFVEARSHDAFDHRLTTEFYPSFNGLNQGEQWMMMRHVEELQHTLNNLKELDRLGMYRMVHIMNRGVTEIIHS
jgi:hypothetical protein